MVIDGDTTMDLFVGRLIDPLGQREKVRDDMLFPIPRGIGLGVIPRPESFYFAFGKPTETAKYAGKKDDQVV